jgi:hypothetical protein
MRAATNIAVILAVVATALAGVKEQSESRRLQYDIPRLERRRDLLERRHRATEAAVARALSARSLLTEHERDCAAAAAGLPMLAEKADLPCPPPGDHP